MAITNEAPPEVNPGPDESRFSGLKAVLPEGPYEDPYQAHEAMVAIEQELEAAGLAHLIPFNAVYRQLTWKVIQHIEFSIANPGHEDAFDEPETVAHTIGIFDDLYAKQLRAFINPANKKGEKVDPAWQFLLYPEDAGYAEPELARYAELVKGGLTPEGIMFLLGMNAHINYDLPLALCESGVHDSYRKDYTKVVGWLIDLTATELAKDYIPGPGKTRDYMKDRVVTMIANWREDAWQSGMALLAAKRKKEAWVGAGEVSEEDRTEADIAIDAIKAVMNRESVDAAKIILPYGSVAVGAIEYATQLASSTKQLLRQVILDLVA